MEEAELNKGTELFQNAMRATVEFHGVDDDLPDIKVFVVKGQEDLSIKVASGFFEL